MTNFYTEISSLSKTLEMAKGNIFIILCNFSVLSENPPETFRFFSIIIEMELPVVSQVGMVVG